MVTAADSVEAFADVMLMLLGWVLQRFGVVDFWFADMYTYWRLRIASKPDVSSCSHGADVGSFGDTRCGAAEL